MRSLLSFVLAAALLTAAAPTSAQVQPGSLGFQWSVGAKDCKAEPQPPLELHAYNDTTYFIRENLCSTFEGPFIYLLIGKTRALLIDTGDVAEPAQAPLAKTVISLLPRIGSGHLPLLVVHTHRHLDHRAGDPQFQHLPDVQVVGYDLASVQRYFGFSHWPQGQAQIDLGGRTVDVLPTPGHNETHLAFYDRNAGLLFSGDFLMPGRLLIDDAAADRASAQRMAAFVANRPVAAVLGGHIELDAAGKTFPWKSQYHPDERPLPMTKADVLALPGALERFNGFYSRSGPFIMMNSLNMLMAMAAGVLVVAIALIWALVALLFRSRRARATAASMARNTT